MYMIKSKIFNLQLPGIAPYEQQQQQQQKQAN